MHLKLLEDFVALSKSQSLFRAAESRNVTHPAFGRRIRALEEWAGVPLVERGPQHTQLNASGRVLLSAAIEVLDILNETRATLQRPEQARARRVSIASGRTLAHLVLPDLMQRMQHGVPPFQVKVVTTTLNYGIDMLVDGEVDMLLCHAHEPIYEKIDNPAFKYRRVGADTLVAVSAPVAPGHPRYVVPRLRSDAPVPFLDYSASMSLGKIMRAGLKGICNTAQLNTVYESDLADAILATARQGTGLAWLPHTLVEQDLRAGTLVRADNAVNDIAMEIRLYVAADNPRALVRQLWSELERGVG
ncbi:hypothetical protein CEG14_12945 [Bordetella genomosp. 1]|uniref:HTH lysR-type domain-containing protein n=1 Tax=Bordetella genomosp. 1 TaxID=1395607 RepID=A0A261SEX1_9BORD|nr:LysR substrate-binding domain-containing protein [Bordetella genomosp. 1]MDQ8034856.1 LysR substrate-binding domain-containing protein [Bordetella sp.]OZI35944.1 hypothetical protein CEG14_12945 [Bordetella genomosp. 1]OZI58612.1 hypothetical protein CAL27_18160 [Bordetella genomosp. 1]